MLAHLVVCRTGDKHTDCFEAVIYAGVDFEELDSNLSSIDWFLLLLLPKSPAEVAIPRL